MDQVSKLNKDSLVIESADGKHHTAFKIKKIPTMRAFSVIQAIRGGLLNILNKKQDAFPDAETETDAFIVTLFGSLSEEAFNSVAEHFWEFTQYRKDNETDWKSLDIDDAFEHLEPIMLYRLYFQAAGYNFFVSCQQSGFIRILLEPATELTE